MRQIRRLFMDLSPLRGSRDYRIFVGGQAISVLGNQLTAVAVPYQTYLITHSSLYVGLVSMTQLIPLIAASLLGGAIVDALDRRRLVLVVETLMLACSAGLAVNADLGARLWPVFACSAVAAGLGGMDNSARNAMIPRMVGLDKVAASSAIFQVLFQVGAIAGPAAAGLLLAGAGLHFVYWLDVASYVGSLLAVFLISPQPPGGAAGRPGLRSIIQGFRFVRGRQALQGAYALDLCAMVFGMPRALFPALAATVFGGGATTVGFLYAAPGAGALLGAVTTGWVGRIRRQGMAVIISVVVWGLAITGFGLVRWLPAALVLLAVAGWADVISAVFRQTILQHAVPEELRGRLMGVHIAVVTGGPRLGDLESGSVATAFGSEFSVVSGGLACVAGALVLVRALPGFRGQRAEGVAASGADVTHGPAVADPAA
jgi:MFS family permease